MNLAMTDLFTASVLTCGAPPEDEGSPAMTRYQLSLLDFWKTQMRSSALDGPYERREMLKLFFWWHQVESLLATVKQ
jgi:hypothetical protein